jgi:hypothetical protein
MIGSKNPSPRTTQKNSWRDTPKQSIASNRSRSSILLHLASIPFSRQPFLRLQILGIFVTGRLPGCVLRIEFYRLLVSRPSNTCPDILVASLPGRANARYHNPPFHNAPLFGSGTGGCYVLSVARALPDTPDTYTSITYPHDSCLRRVGVRGSRPRLCFISPIRRSGDDPIYTVAVFAQEWTKVWLTELKETLWPARI